MTLLVYLLLGISTLVGNYYKFSLFSPDVRISLLDLSVAIITLVSFRRNYILTTKQFSQLTKPIFIFFVICLLSLIPAYFNYGQSAALVGLMYSLRWLTYSLFFISLSVIQVPIKNLIILISSIFISTGLAQYFFLPDTRFLLSQGWDDHFNRAIGTILDPGFLGLLYVFILLFTKNKILWVLSFLTLILTYSRASYLAFLAGFAFSRKSFLKVLLLLTVTVTLLPRPGGDGVKLERVYSIFSRFSSWQQAWRIFADHPVLGVGFNVYRYAQRDYGFQDDPKWQISHANAGSDSSLLFVLATTGLLGLTAYSWYLYQLSTINQQLITVVFVHSLFLNSLFYPFILLWISLIMADSLQQSPSPSGSPPHPPPPSSPGSRRASAKIAI
ncbi:O-antigen ligase family protein [Candidatus Amesbacteria bacterium]|nr:O-antigen ligase family protein [Candidatus Amesbacteria bacterium]